MDEQIAGYRVIRELGSGGMGTVYLVDHPRLPRQDALKLLPVALSRTPGFRDRFEREAETLARLDHPNIVRVYDRGESDERLWIAMEYLPDGDAAEAVASRGPFHVAEAVNIVAAVADALDYAWRTFRLTHRDVKPANILLRRGDDGSVTAKLGDFGLAKLGAEQGTLTAATTIGTLAYLSPETIEGRPVDDRTDQYSLACTAYFLLTGRNPFSGPSAAAVFAAHLTHPMPSVGPAHGAAAPVLDAVLARATAKDPAQRFGSVAEFATALREALRPRTDAYPPTAFAARPPAWQPTSTQPYTAAHQAHPEPHRFAHAPATGAHEPTRRSAPWIVAGIVAVVAVIGLAAALFAFRGDDAQADSPVAAGASTSTERPAESTKAAEMNALLGNWTGSYTCNQGATSLVLQISGGSSPDELDVVFLFGPTSSNPSVPEGSYSMTATMSGDDLQFTPDSWIDRPGEYMMVPLRVPGPVDTASRTMTGDVLSAGCSTFSVSR